MDYMSDEQIDGLFEQADYYPDGPRQPQQAQPQQGGAIVPYQAPPPVPLYPLAMAQQGGGMGQAPAQQPGVVGLATKQVGPLPLWAWLLLGGTTAAGGYYFLKSRKSSESSSSSEGNESSSSSSGIMQALMGGGSAPAQSSGSGWSPSRSGFADRLTSYFTKKGFSEHVVVWHDAEDAKSKGGLSHVSPLINVQVKGGGVKCDTALQRFCRRDGLNPVQHADGSIGLYPHTGKRGKEWEEYIDALRDEGQTV